MKKILIVETSPTITSVADSLLRQRGYDVTCLADGNKAVEFTRSERPDLILSGLGLVGIDGIQLCSKITQDPLTGGIPVILMIGDRDGAYIEKIGVCGAKGSLKKPFSPKELISVVEKFAGKGALVQSGKPVNQSSAGSPKLKPKAAAEEIKSSTRSLDKEAEKNKKHETVFNLDWNDLANPDEEQGSAGGGSAPDMDDSGLILEEDQYGLTNIANEIVPATNKPEDEDYEWFISEMKKDTDSPAEKKAPPESQPAAEPKISYQDLGARKDGDDVKYRRFLDQFKKETDTALDEKPASGMKINIDQLVDEISSKLARKILENIDKQELKQLILAALKEIK
jgi:two-component system chemotaxis response regulator CheY